jgi:hypothetical protein
VWESKKGVEEIEKGEMKGVRKKERKEGRRQ